MYINPQIGILGLFNYFFFEKNKLCKNISAEIAEIIRIY